MKFNLNTSVLDYEGDVIKQPVPPKPGARPEPGQPQPEEELNFRVVINAAINNEAPGQTIAAEQKAKIYQISIKIWKNWKVDFTHDDCAFIKERGALTLNALMLGRLDDFLEGKEIELPLSQEEQDKELEDAERPTAKAE
jgi:hypothetical protein